MSYLVLKNYIPTALFSFMAISLLVGCSNTMHTQGQIIPEENLAMLEEGQHDKLGVLRLLGSPSSESLFEDNKWLYMTTKTESRPFRHDEVLEQNILILEFDKNDKLDRISRLNKENAQLITPLPQKTKTQGQSLGILDQMFENLGNGFGRTIE